MESRTCHLCGKSGEKQDFRTTPEGLAHPSCTSIQMYRTEVKQAAETAWSAIAFDVMKAQEYCENPSQYNDRTEPKNEMKRETVIEVVLDHIRTHGEMSKEVETFYEDLSFTEKVKLIGEQMSEEIYVY